MPEPTTPAPPQPADPLPGPSARPAGRARCVLPTRRTGSRPPTAWLLDLCPPEYRTYPALRRHAVVLARFAVLHVEACQAAVNQGLSEARGGLREVAEGSVVEAAVETWHRESARLLGVRRAVGLVEEALRGRRFVGPPRRGTLGWAPCPGSPSSSSSIPQGRVLLQHRDEHAPRAANQWGMVGGHVEHGEDFDIAVHREILEETGIVTAPRTWCCGRRRSSATPTGTTAPTGCTPAGWT